MDMMSGRKGPNNAASIWEGLLGAAAGVGLLWAAWAFYHDHLGWPGIEWYAWIRPALLVLGGVLSLVAAALLAARRPEGRGVLRLAIGTIPVFFAAGLVVVALRFVGFVGDVAGGAVGNPDQLTIDALLDRLRFGPLALANVIVVALIILPALFNKAGRSGGAEHERADER